MFTLHIATPEYGKYFSARIPSLYLTNTAKYFYEKIITNFIKLNDPECLRKLIESLLILPVKKQPKHRYLDIEKDCIWPVIISHKESSILIPYIFDIMEQTSLQIENEILLEILQFMVTFAENKTFVSPPKFYNLLFSRISFEILNSQNLDYSFKKLLAEKMIQMGDESAQKSLVQQVLTSSNWRTIITRKCKFTSTSFLNRLFDDYINYFSTKNGLEKDFIEMYTLFLNRNIDTNRLIKLLSVHPNSLLRVDNLILDESNLPTVLVDQLMSVAKVEGYNDLFLNVFTFYDDLGIKMLQNIERIDNIEKKKVLFSHELYKSLSSYQLLYPISKNNCSSKCLSRTGRLISLFIDYFATYDVDCWKYPSDQLPSQLGISSCPIYQNEMFRIKCFLTKDIQAKEFQFCIRIQDDVICFLNNANINVTINGYICTLEKTKKFPNPYETKSAIRELGYMLQKIHHEDESPKNVN